MLLVLTGGSLINTAPVVKHEFSDDGVDLEWQGIDDVFSLSVENLYKLLLANPSSTAANPRGKAVMDVTK